MEGEREQSPPPFWTRTSSSSYSSASYASASSSSSCSSGIRPWILVLLLSLFTLLFLPSLFSSSIRGTGTGPSASLAFRNGWDVLNLALVVFAILCGVLSRGGAGEENENSPTTASAGSGEWGGYAIPTTAQASHGEGERTATVGIGRMRSSSSYPDLRNEEGAQWRFYDDAQLYRGRRSEWNRDGNGEDALPKTIPVDTFVLRRTPPRSPSPPPVRRKRSVEKLPSPSNASTSPPPPPPTSTVLHHLFSSKNGGSKSRRIHSISAPPPPPPPPPPSTSARRSKKQQIPITPPPPPPPPPPQTLRSSKHQLSQPRSHSQRIDRSILARYPLPPPSPLPPTPPPPPPSPPPPPPPLPGFCPSPDVNAKADNFIRHFRAGLKLEKLNSIRERQRLNHSVEAAEAMSSSATVEECL